MTNTYTIGEIAAKFGLHKDTLRNWEKDGLVVPDRVGPRGDRVYTDEHIAIIVDKKLAQSVSSLGSTASIDTDKMSLAQLKTFLWKSADILRGKIDSSDYKKYIFGLLFYKRMSDVWQEEYEKALAEYHDDEIAKADYNHRFQVPEDARWEVVQNTATDIGLKLNEVFDKITNANSPKLDKIFDDLDFANSDRFPNETLQRLINHFSKHKFGETYFSSDVLGDAYEYLIQQFAADAGKKGGEFYTPREVERLIMHILKPHEKDHIYDPAVGSGGFLLEAYHYTREKDNEQKARSLYLYGQEINMSTYAIGKINMFLHGLDGADIRRGDTLADPQFLTAAGTLKTFDIVVANFPYSIKEWAYDAFKNDKYGRTEDYDTPPATVADYAFILHILKSLNENGKAGVVVPHGVLFRGGVEGRIRKQIILNDYVEAIVALPPKLFYGTGIPAAILILNKNKPTDRRNKIIIVDAENDFEAGKNQNRLRKDDIDTVASTVNAFATVDKYATVVTTEDVAANNYSLNFRLYVDSNAPEEVIDYSEVSNTLMSLSNEYAELQTKIKNYLDNMVFNIDSPTHGSWKTVKLGDIAKIKTGSKNNQDKTPDGKYPFYVRSDKILRIDTYSHDGEAILVPGEGRIGEIFHYIDGKFDVHQRVYKISDFSEKVHGKYLYYYLQMFFGKHAGSSSVKATVDSLRLPTFQDFEILLPDLEEQKRIATLLTAMDLSIKKSAKLSSEQTRLKRSLMQNLLSGKARV
jgi:type I restriction enzyme M protein